VALFFQYQQRFIIDVEPMLTCYKAKRRILSTRHLKEIRRSLKAPEDDFSRCSPLMIIQDT